MRCPVLLLAGIITVGRVPAAVEQRFLAAIDAPLLLLRFLHGTNPLQLALLAYLVDDARLLQFHVFAHLAQHQVGIVLQFGDFLLVAVFELLYLQLQHFNFRLQGAAVVGQIGQRVLDHRSEEIRHLVGIVYQYLRDWASPGRVDTVSLGPQGPTWP